MENNSTSITAKTIKRILFCSVVLFSFNVLKAQVPTWVNFGFSASPYPSTPSYFLSNGNNSWTEGEINGTVGWPNKWVYTVQNGTTPTYQTTTGGFLSTGVTVTNHAQYAGSGYLQYNNRSANLPVTTNVAPAGDQGYIATPALDFTGHTTYNAAADTFGFWFWRDATATGSMNTYYDSIVVYINTAPVLAGTDLVKLTEINTNSSFIPRSSTIAPLQAPVGSGWRRCTYRIPNTTAYVGATPTTTAYILIVAYSRGGGNMFLDDFDLPQWQTTMQIQQALIYYQENADVDKNTTGNLILGVKVITRGSLSPLLLDAATFSTAGSTAFASDVQNPLCYYTGASSNFAMTGGPIIMPLNAVGPAPGLLNFGWFGATCINTTPASMQLSPGSENYIWLTYDIKSTATTNNYVGADFQFITSKIAGTCYFAGAGTPQSVYTNILPQTQNKARRIDLAYAIPLYNAGLGVPGYWDIDCISAVHMVGENGTMLQNYNHDDTCHTCTIVHPIGAPRHPWCVRWSCHPNDYTNFKPENKGTYKNRFVQILKGQGIRTGTAPYQLRLQHGDVFSRIGVFIDWNRDGDFDDTYYKSSGAPDSIRENYGTHTFTGSAVWSAYPVVAWPVNALWNINVPEPTDLVKDWNDVLQPPNNSNTPMLIANVRMRLREAVNNVTIHPFIGGYTEGETEDYTLQVLEQCPAPGYNVCKWIGNTSDWNTISNWCPSIPTLNDMAYIPKVNTAVFSYPKIGSNTTAQCRMLKLMDDGLGNGAKLYIDAPNNSSLTVADDVIIGQDAPAGGSSSGIYINSIFNKIITIPGASVTPPAGNGLTSNSIFQSARNIKLQIAYTASELATTFGWQPGDYIDTISMVFKSTSGALMTISNFRIVKYEFNGPMVWTNPAAVDADICVRSGTPSGAVPVYVLGNATSGVTLNINLPNTGTSQLSIPLNANSFVWNGSDLVLSFEWFGAALQGSTQYVNYYESSSTYNFFGVKSNTGAVSYNSVTSGYFLSGYNATLVGGANASITQVFATSGYCASNLRPRLDFHVRRPYTRFDFYVGGNFINNNKHIRSAPYGITPVYGIAGDSGFVGNYSKVVFDPSMRSLVTTPGYPGNPGLTATSMFNPVAQGATLIIDQEQLITSANTASTSFNQLEINKISPSGFVVKQNSTGVSLIGASADSLALTDGGFGLNRKEFTLRSSGGGYLQRTNGWIISEDNTGGGLAGNMQSIFKWNIGTNTGMHSIPFGINGSSVFNFSVNLTAGDLGTLSLATYRTPSTNNTPYPFPALPVGNPLHVVNMTTNPSPIVDATPWTVDRFWYVDRSTTSAIAGTMTFEYDNSNEGTLTSAYVSGEMKAQNYQLSGANPGWHAPYAGQTDGSVSAAIKYVNHNAQYIDATYNIWVITHINAGQAPLPVELINFDAKAINDKVRIWWDVQSESNVANYKIERTTDQHSYDSIASSLPVGLITGIADYEKYDLKPLSGLQFYRLATTFTDGSIDYSALKPVLFSGRFEIINVFANTSASSIDVTFNYNSKLPYEFRLTDLYGKVIASGINNAKEGLNELSIPVQPAHGVYFISLSNSVETVSQKLVY